MSLFVKGKDVPAGGVVGMKMVGGRLETRVTYGGAMNIYVAYRGGHYHSTPHIHEAEQLNYLAKGKLWLYIDGLGAYLMEAGDFTRVPKSLAHWSCNPSDQDNLLYEIHFPKRSPANFSNNSAVGMFDEFEEPNMTCCNPNMFLSNDIHQLEEGWMKNFDPKKPGTVFIKGRDVPNSVIAAIEDAGLVSRKTIYGNGADIMMTEYKPGYHSTPHVMDSERMCYVSEGKVWFFMGEKGYLMEAGDYIRVPQGRVSWASNTFKESCILFETHSPVINPDVFAKDSAIGLFDKSEKKEMSLSAQIVPAVVDYKKIEAGCIK